MRFLAALFMLVLATTAGAYPPPPKPTPAGELPAVVLQAAPISQWIDDIRIAIKTIIPGAEADRVLQEFNDGLSKNLDNLDGFDLKKPVSGFVLFGEEPQATALVLVVPYTDEAKVVASISRGKPKATAVAGKKGLYKYDAENDPAPFPIFLRFHEGYVYAGINTPAEVLEASLIPATKLIDPTEKAHLAVKAKNEKIPASLVKIAKDGVGEFVKNMRKSAAQSNPISEKAAELFGAFVTRQSDTYFSQSDTTGLRIHFDTKTGEMTNEYIVAAKAGTTLATDIAARKMVPNRFGGLANKDNAATVIFRAPLFAQELRDLASMGLRELKASGEDSAPPLFHPLITEMVGGLERSVKAGSLDVGFIITGPNAGGKFTSTLAIGIADATKVDEEIQKVVKAIAPKAIQDAITWNAEKVGDVAIHEMDLSKVEQIPSDVLGKNAKLCMAFTKEMIVTTTGEDARAQLKAVLAIKTAAHAPVVDIKINPKKIEALLTAAKVPVPNAIGLTELVLGLSTIDVTGGDRLTVKQTINLKVFTTFTGGRAAQGNFQAVPATPVPVKP